MLAVTSQLIHLGACKIDVNIKFLSTYIYASNADEGKQILWVDLRRLAGNINKPWTILGDFNNVLRSFKI